MQKKDLNSFVNLLLKYNSIHNITGAKNIDRVWSNIEDSLEALKYIENFNSLLDIGSGAGFPGLIFAIANKNKSIYLCEPKQKKAAFLRVVVSSLKLSNVTIIQKRVQEVKDLKVDIISSRAVSETKVLLELGKPFEKKDTKYLLFKGERVFEEIKDIKREYKVFQKGKRRYLIINP